MHQADQRIRVLLLDDEVNSLAVKPAAAKKYFPGVDFTSTPDAENVPVLRSAFMVDRALERTGLSELFELRWLATAEEAREFRDLSMSIMAHSPAVLSTQGWVPEIVIFDYALTRDERPVQNRRFPPSLIPLLSPLPGLRRCAGERSIPAAFPGKRPFLEAGPTFDNLGCHAGMLLVNLFRDHPCAPLPTTEKVGVGEQKTAGAEAAFVEWMYEHDYGRHLFKNAPRHVLSWNELLIAAAPALRGRIERLVADQQLEVNLEDLAALERDGLGQHLRLHSRFGTRSLPVRGLFLESLDDGTRISAVRNWASKLFAILCHGNSSVMVDVREGQELARHVWDDGYDNEEAMEQRLTLSRLLHRVLSGVALSVQEEEQLNILRCDREFAVRKEKAGSKDSYYVGNADRVVEIGMGGHSEQAKRWAALQILVLLLKRKWDAQTQARRDGFYADIVLSDEHFYLACYPLPERPVVLPWHDGKRAAATWRELSKKYSVDIGLLLKGGGVSEGERAILRHLAQAAEFPRDQWERDPLARLVLLGKE